MASNDTRHSDSAVKVEPAATSAGAATAHTRPAGVDNGEQAARAFEERERTFTTGGDAEPAAPAAQAPSALARVDALTARLRAGGQVRPSPFGVAQFPPLPVPPGVSSRS